MKDVSKLEDQPLGKLIFSMCTHTSLALLLYSIYSLTDTLIIAWGISEYAAGAVSIASPLLIILGAFSTTAGTGGASLISRALGRKNLQDASAVAGNVFLSFWCLAVVITMIGLLFLDPLLRFLGASGELYPYAKEYAVIILAGAITSTGFSSLIRAEGAAKFALKIWLIPVVLNIVLDIIFVFWFKIGVSGAALATVMAQAVSVCMSLWFFFFRKERTYQIERQHFRIQPKIVIEVVAIGFPSLINQISSIILIVILNRILGAAGGEAAITAFGFAVRIQMLMLLPQNGIVQGIQPIIGYNYSSKNKNRIKNTIKIAFCSSVVYGLVICLVGVLLRRPLLMLFTKDDTIISIGSSALLFMLTTLPIKGYSPLISACFQSIGDIKKL